MADQNVIGLVAGKINGVFAVDITDMSCTDGKSVNQYATGGGVKKSTGLEMPSGSMGEVIPKDKQLDLRSLKNFAIEFYDYETQSILIASFTGCDWDNATVNSNQASATTSRKWNWKGTDVIKI